MLLIIAVLTYLLLVRAFRSLLLPLKAVVLNLVSLGATLGLMVLLLTTLREHVNREVWWVRWLVGVAAVFPLQLLVRLHERFWQDAALSWPRMFTESFATAAITGLLAAVVLAVPAVLGTRNRRFTPYRRW